MSPQKSRERCSEERGREMRADSKPSKALFDHDRKSRGADLRAPRGQIDVEQVAKAAAA